MGFTEFDESFINQYKNKQPNWGFNGLGYVVYKRTYARLKKDGKTEEWFETVRRCIEGAQKIGAEYTQEEAEQLFDYVFNLKCNFAGRMLWQLGTPTVDRFGANSLLNCWFTSVKEPRAFLFIFENLMLGGGLGFSIRREDIHELPKVKKDVKITHINTKDADFIVPDSRQGWVELLNKLLQAFYENGKSFTYSTILVRGAGEKINGFGGTASGPQILINGIDKIVEVFRHRKGKKLRSIDVLDVCNIIGSIVVAGNVRRSAEIAIGDPDDYLYLRAKNWSLGAIPNWRAMSNNTIGADSYDQISEEVWGNGYELKDNKAKGEPYGFFNLPLSQNYGRLKDESFADDCSGLNPSMPKGVLVQTTHGIFPIEKLQDLNFSVRNFFNEIVPAKCVLSGENKQVYKISFGYGRHTYATAEHKWPVVRRGQLTKVETINLTRYDRIPLNLNERLEIKGKYNFNREDGLLIGYLIGDGWLCKRKDRDAFTGGLVFNKSESVIAERIVKLLNSKKKNISNVIEQEDSLEIQFSDKVFCGELIEKYGLKLSKEKDIPDTIWESNDEFIIGVIDGLFSTDGSVSVEDREISLVSSREFIIDKVMKLLSFYGINCVKSKSKIDNAKFPNGKDYKKTYYSWKLKITCGKINKFTKIFEISHPEKAEKLKKISIDSKFAQIDYSQYYAEVQSVKEDSIQDVWDISVYDDAHVFPSQFCFTGNCGEVTLSNYECCNLSELYLNNISSQEELNNCAKLLYKTQKAIAKMPFIHEETNKIVHKNMRLGLGVTGICQSLDKLEWLDGCYNELRRFDKEWSAYLKVPESIKLTVVKPSGSLSLLAGATPGVHPSYSQYYIRRVRMGSDDKLGELCRSLGYHTEFVQNFDGSLNRDTIIVEFPCMTPKGTILAKDMSVTKQLDLVKQLQTVWADNAVSVTAYYSPEELDDLKNWMRDNYEKNIKSVSFLLRSQHGFIQAPYEEITEEKYLKLKSKVKPLTNSVISTGEIIEGIECEGGACPLR